METGSYSTESAFVDVFQASLSFLSLGQAQGFSMRTWVKVHE